MVILSRIILFLNTLYLLYNCKLGQAILKLHLGLSENRLTNYSIIYIPRYMLVPMTHLVDCINGVVSVLKMSISYTWRP